MKDCKDVVCFNGFIINNDVCSGGISNSCYLYLYIISVFVFVSSWFLLVLNISMCVVFICPLVVAGDGGGDTFS